MSGTDERPALVVAKIVGHDVVACMVTKKKSNFDTCIELGNADMTEGSLAINPSYIRPLRLVTIDSRTIVERKGRISDALLDLVFESLRNKFTR
jgi:mRNA-degrading endonuclease toxin of MazEF toxin-antitoxin module